MISVLYVDDEPDLLALCKTFLEKNPDFTVDTCISATEAFSRVNSHPYDAIVSDYLMTEMNGIDLLKKMRQHSGNIPYILFTGKGREDVAIEALNNGADFYIQKGYDAASRFIELQHLIEQAVGERRAAEALRVSLETLHHAEIITGLGHWTFHLDSNKVSVSPGAREIYGLDEHEWSITEIQKIPLPEYRSLLDISLKDLITQNRPYDVEFKIKRFNDGKMIDIHSIAEYDPHKNCVFGTIQDITKIKEVERELRRKNEELQRAHDMISASEEDLVSYVSSLSKQKEQTREKEASIRLLSDNLPNGLVYQIVVDTEGNRHFQYISAGVRNIHQLDPEDVLDDPFSLYHQVIEEDKATLIDLETRALVEKTPFSGEFRIRRPDGQICWIHLRSIPRDLPDGSILWDGIELDVTDQKRTEEALKEFNEIFSEIMRYSPIYVYIKIVTPTESRVLYASENFRDMVGIPGSKMIGMTMTDLFPDEFAKKMTADDWTVISSGKMITLYEDLHDHNFISIKFPIIQRKRTLLAGFTIDITEFRQTQKTLQEANKKLKFLTGLTRHDIYNEIAIIQGFLALMEDSADLNEINTYVRKAKKACEQMTATIGFTREYEDFGTTFSEWHHLAPIIESANAEVNTEDITIVNLIPGELEINTDPIIRKIFTTLLENALRHGKNITIIRFFTTEKDDALVITYEDDGVGVPIDEKEKIFTHGYGKHTGMGLFLAKEILSITGLSIRENGEPGKGARFEILIPHHKFRYADPSLHPL